MTRSGSIVAFDAKQISIATSSGSNPDRYSSDRVIDVELAVVPTDQATALKAFREKNYEAALPALIRSISSHDAASRPPVWRQQWLSMVAATAAARSGRAEIALELVEQLDARPLPAMILGLLPIDWTGQWGADPAIMKAASERASSESLAVKLVAASWLLKSPKYRAAAETALERLASQSEREHLAALARQVRWRTKSPPEITKSIRSWENEIDSLAMSLQTGPMIAIGQHTRQIGLEDVAKKWELTLELAAPSWHPDL